MDTGHLFTELTGIVGSGNVRAQDVSGELPLPSGWNTRPLAMLVPGSADEVAQVVIACEAAGVALLPVGGGTQLQTGYPPRDDKPYVLLSTAHMNRVLDYQPDDMTITCEPGMTLANLQAHLREHRQILPLDAPYPAQATMGGLVSANQCGFWRFAYGTPRDLVIGLHAVMTDGARVKGGGKVVKNVAGYDVCKLFTGAWGTAGIVTEITFRVRPLPESERVIRLDAPDLATAARAGMELHRAQLAPIALLVTNEITSGNGSTVSGGKGADGTACLLALLQGSEARMDWQTTEMARLGGPLGLHAPQVVPVSTLNTLGDAQARLGADTPLAGRIACLLTDVEPICRALETLPGLRLTADVAMGILHFAAHEPDANLVQTIRNVVPHAANLRWVRVDEAIVARVGVGELNRWGETRETTALQRALKQAIDPNGTFSPERFVGRL